ncbi:MAG TPA: hypothetical protein VFQ22_05835, partial [Longimicrobiales bacterium]|nr:hypothetical protein [Longimicrobiales bacterium]
MRSLEKQLPIASFSLLTLLASTLTWAAYRQARATSLELYGERLTRISDQFAQSVGATVERTRAQIVQTAADPAVVGALVDPTPANAEAAAAVL